MAATHSILTANLFLRKRINLGTYSSVCHRLDITTYVQKFAREWLVLERNVRLSLIGSSRFISAVVSVRKTVSSL